MYECQIVEVEDMNFCHYINHFDEVEEEYFTEEEKLEFEEVIIDYKEYEEFKKFYNGNRY